MTKAVSETLLLDASVDYRERFELRFFQYSEVDRLETANAVMDCAAGLAKHLGHMPDNIIFGRSVFSLETTERLVRGLYKLQAQAEEGSFEIGLTAVLALQSVASLLMVGHLSKASSILLRRERELDRMGTHMEHLYDIRRTALGQKSSAPDGHLG